MTPNWAAIWSAIAASFSAIASLLTLWIHRRNLVESTRPELVLFGWDRRRDDPHWHDHVSFSKIANVGRGAAFNLHFGFVQIDKDKPIASLQNTYFPIVASSKEIENTTAIMVIWNNAGSYIRIPFTITCTDGRGIRYETRYKLWVFEDKGYYMHGAEAIGPGLYLIHRETVARSIWIEWLKVKVAHMWLSAFRRIKQSWRRA